MPPEPGVYTFLGDKGRILYIGKATSLRDRVRSYFSGDIVETRSKLIEDMVHKTKDVEVEQTDSVLEALILEAYKIKTHKCIRKLIKLTFNSVVAAVSNSKNAQTID